jgi:hypothetical protein
MPAQARYGPLGASGRWLSRVLRMPSWAVLLVTAVVGTALGVLWPNQKIEGARPAAAAAPARRRSTAVQPAARAHARARARAPGRASSAPFARAPPGPRPARPCGCAQTRLWRRCSLPRATPTRWRGASAFGALFLL